MANNGKLPTDPGLLAKWLFVQRDASGLRQLDIANELDVTTRTVMRWERRAPREMVSFARYLVLLGATVSGSEPLPGDPEDRRAYIVARIDVLTSEFVRLRAALRAL